MIALSRTIAVGAAALSLAACATVPAPQTGPSLDMVEERLAEDIGTLAADDFGGRYPGSEGEAKTQRWLIQRYSEIGLQPGAGEGDWTQDFTLVRRLPLEESGASTATVTRGSRSVSLSQGLIAVDPGRDDANLADVPIVGLDPDIEELQPRSLVNRAVRVPAAELPRLFSKFEAAAPKALIITTQTAEEYEKTAGLISHGRWRLGSDTSGPAVLLLSPQSSAGLSDAIGANAKRHPDGLGLIAYDTILKASIAQKVDRIETANVIGRLPGRVPGAGAVVLLAHWDHLGDDCGPPDATDRLCNGAVDNASGLAVMIEAVRIALQGGPLDRDVIVLATSSEELGLLGAKAFVADPPVPLPTIAAAFNLDTMAIAPRGTPVVVLGAGKTALDYGISEVARVQGREIVSSDLQDAFLPRQDGWALLVEGVPAVLVSSALADRADFESFMGSDYHRATDAPARGVELGGAAEDTLLHAALIRYFASLKTYPGGGG
ncbi:M28 family peptidase [Erythrobacter sp. YJ-T3-07]|uniref:M28 family peptidase n=1 Tax=Erythrobacter sp. YJ-T3-07 TaxID=2793063 RepID=UPI0018D3DA0C|nr:M28 family peptidase [Erythrobacter sp. YJ-T3-07]MBH1943765.1 M28 family peptidase [Erythrobacter sp. YJ-T3-07]